MNLKNVQLEGINDATFNRLVRFWGHDGMGEGWGQHHGYAQIVAPMVFPDYESVLRVFGDNRHAVAAVYKGFENGHERTTVQALRGDPQVLEKLATSLQRAPRDVELQFARGEGHKQTKVRFRQDGASGILASYSVSSPTEGRNFFTWMNGVRLEQPRFYALLASP
jgi:hypothetical protein